MKIFILSFFLATVTSYMPLVHADSCQWTFDQDVIERAIETLKKNYSDLNKIVVTIAPTPQFYFEPYTIEISNPRLVDGQGIYALEVEQSREDGTAFTNWPDLGITFYKDHETGKFVNLASTAGCKTFGKIYPSLDEVVKP